MPNSDSVAVLVISCDAYRDLWPPFFELFWRHWPDCPYPVYLGSEEQTHPDPRVRSLTVGLQTDWSSSCARMLERIDAPITLVLQEDFLFYDRVDTARIAELVTYMRAHDAACLRLYPCPGPDEPCADDPRVGLIRPGSPFRLSMQAALWDTSVFRGLPVRGEDIWQFESGQGRIAHVAQPFFSVQRAHRPMRYFCTGVRRGLWLRDAIRMCRSQGVQVDLRARQREALRAYLRRMVKFRLEGCRIPACRDQHPQGCIRHPSAGG